MPNSEDYGIMPSGSYKTDSSPYNLASMGSANRRKKISIKTSGRAPTMFAYPFEGNLRRIVMFCHGFPGSNRLENLRPKLARAGYQLFEVNYGGDKASTGTFSFSGSTRDVAACAEWLHKRHPDFPIVALGYSAGAMYLINSLQRTSAVFSKLILLCPAVNPGFFIDSPLMDQLWRDARGIIRLKNLSFYKKELKACARNANPMLYAAKVKSPVHLLCAEHEEILSNRDILKFYRKLRCKKKLSVIAKARHGLNGNERALVAAVLEN